MNAGVVSAKPVNDTAILRATAVLSSNFAYVWADFALELSQDTANDWGSRGTIRFVNGTANIAAGFRESYPFLLEDSSRTTGGTPEEFATGRVVGDFHCTPIWRAENAQAAGPLMDVDIYNNNVAVSAAGQIWILVSFWEYDLEQIKAFPANIGMRTF